MPSRDPMKWMWAEALEMMERADRLHRQFFQLGRSEARGPSWEPPVDIFESESQLGILVALPGVSPREVDVLVEGGILAVRGERPLPGPFREGTIRRLEIPYGHFERRIELPPGRYALSGRQLIDGCLLLTLSKLT